MRPFALAHRQYPPLPFRGEAIIPVKAKPLSTSGAEQSVPDHDSSSFALYPFEPTVWPVVNVGTVVQHESPALGSTQIRVMAEAKVFSGRSPHLAARASTLRIRRSAPL